MRPVLNLKSRTTIRNAEDAIHGVSIAAEGRVLLARNMFWTLLFDWWLSLLSFIVAGIACVVQTSGRDYEMLIYELGWYIFWSFGKHVEGSAGISTRGDDANHIGDTLRAVVPCGQ